MLDPIGHVSSWNAGAERIKGFGTDEIIGKHFSNFYTEEDRTAGVPRTALETARREGRYEAEGWRVRKDGTRFWASVVIDAIQDKDGKLIPELSVADAKALIADGTISGGMIPKVETCLEALDNGVEGVVILNGKMPHVVLVELFTEFGAGTLIVR